MKSIAELDPNFKLPEDVPADMQFHSPFDSPFTIYGLAENEKGVYCRLPEKMLPDCSEGVQNLAYHLSGACVRFSTDASRLAVLWTLTDTGNMPHFAASGQSGMELFEETDHGVIQVKNLIPAMDGGHGCKANQSACFPLQGGMRHYALYLPLYNGLKELLIGVDQKAAVEPGRVPAHKDPIVFYGNSVTQGGCAAKAGSSFTTILCRRLDAAQVNLGFSGNGKGEALMAEYIAGLPMTMFVMDYDHNAPTVEHLQATHEPFFKIIREKNPDLPIVMLSRCSFPFEPERSEPYRKVIETTYQNALAAGDKNVYFVNGQTLFGDMDRDLCTVDNAHPTELGFLRMANALEPLLRSILDK